MREDVLLPPGARLLHIGPHKTATTAVQGALRQARDAMAEHGVVYAGRERQHYLAALAVTGGTGFKGDPPASRRHWDTLVEQVTAAGEQRVVISSEFFDDARPDVIPRILDELGGPRVHVVVTLRPLSKILPSAWQQYVRNKLRTGYEDWLEAMLRVPPYVQPTPTFWYRHRHDELLERWVNVAGAQNVTVVVVDESDHSVLLHAFEDLLGLPRGFLEPERGWTNRSLTLGETELIRHLNLEFERRRWPDALYRQYVSNGMVIHLQQTRQPGPDEPRLQTPPWALKDAAEIGAGAAERIRGTGVRIIGDISTLAAAPVGTEADDSAVDGAPPAVLPAEAAMRAVTGAILAGNPLPSLGQRRVEQVRSADLLRTVARRGLARVPRSRDRLRTGAR